MTNSERISIFKVKIVVGLLAFAWASMASGVELSNIITDSKALQAIDFSRNRVVFIGESDHFEPGLIQVELQILNAIEESNSAKRKCLLLEADPRFDEAFQMLSRSTTTESVTKANALLDRHDLMASQIRWIGETYPISFFEFAQAHQWTVRSGDMLRGADYWETIRNGDFSDEWMTYHQIHLRNLFMAKRVEQLLNTDCDLVVGLFGSTHLTHINWLPTYKVRNQPVPSLLEKKSLSSMTVIATNFEILSRFELTIRQLTKERAFRAPEAFIATPAPTQLEVKP